MTATAFAIEPELDRFEDERFPHEPRQPQLRLVVGQDDLAQDRQPYGRHAALSLVVPPTGLNPTVEIYRRRRFFALVAATLVVLTVAWMAGISLLSFGTLDSSAGADGASAAASSASQDAAPVVHVVLPGDSYGAIAADLGVANPAEAAELIRASNGGGELVVGQRVVIDLTRLAAAG